MKKDDRPKRREATTEGEMGARRRATPCDGREGRLRSYARSAQHDSSSSKWPVDLHPPRLPSLPSSAGPGGGP